MNRDAFDTWRQSIDSLQQATMAALPRTLEVIPAVLARGEANRELASRLTDCDRVIHLKGEAEAARAAVETALGGAGELEGCGEYRELCKLHRMTVAWADCCVLATQPGHLGIAAAFALHSDPTGGRADGLLAKVFGLHGPRLAGSLGLRSRGEAPEARPLLRRALFELLLGGAGGVTATYEGVREKSRAYVGTAVRNTAARLQWGRRIEDKDRLEVGPKGERRRTPADVALATDEIAERLTESGFAAHDLEMLVTVKEQVEAATEDPRERAVLYRIAAGATPPDACRAEGLKPRTWENIQKRIRRRSIA